MRSYTVIILGALLSLSLIINVVLLSNMQSNLSDSLAKWLPIKDLESKQKPVLNSNTTHIFIADSSNIKNTNLAATNQTPLKHITHLFEQQKFPQAIDLYLTLTKNQQSTVRQSWLNQLELLLQQKQANVVLKFCQYFLQQLPDDQTIMQVLAKAYIGRGDLLYGIELYYQLSRQLPPSEENSLLKLIHQHAHAEIKRFSDSSSWDELTYFVSPLLNYEADYPPYLLALAQAHLHLQSYDEALLPLVTITTDPKYGEQATELEDKILLELTKLEAISLVSYGAHFITSGIVNGEHAVDLMIDTGASLSVMSTAHFEELAIGSGIELTGERKIATAGGEVTAPVYRFDSFSINQYEVKDIEFVVLDLESLEGSNGLLGMNFLSNFKFEIEQEQKLLILNERTKT